MKIHEYQAKELLRKYGVVTPRGFHCISVDAAVKAAEDLGGKVWVVKAQIHAGGRGKGGGVKLAKSPAEAKELASKMLGMMLKTIQTGPEGQKVRRLYIEEGCNIARELYLGVVLDREKSRVCFMASAEGGMDIEEVAAKHPDKIFKISVDPAGGLQRGDALGHRLGQPRVGRAQVAAARAGAVVRRAGGGRRAAPERARFAEGLTDQRRAHGAALLLQQRALRLRRKQYPSVNLL